MLSFSNNKNGRYRIICKNSGNVVLEKNYSNNLLDGQYTYYWDNGKIRLTGQYEKMHRMGTWKTYESNGDLMYEKNYDHKESPQTAQLVLLPI